LEIFFLHHLNRLKRSTGRLREEVLDRDDELEGETSAGVLCRVLWALKEILEASVPCMIEKERIERGSKETKWTMKYAVECGLLCLLKDLANDMVASADVSFSGRRSPVQTLGQPNEASD
jgi:hypothetical protein